MKGVIMTNNINQSFRYNAIGIYPEFVRIAGANAGVLLSQLFNWIDEDNWLNKTETEITQATCLDAHEIRSAMAQLKKLGIVESNESSAYRLNLAVLAEAVKPLLR